MSKAFQQQNSPFIKKLGKRWRKPRGHQSKMRKKKSGSSKMPNIGYGTCAEQYGKIQQNGQWFTPVVVHNIQELEGLGPDHAIIPSATLGSKKLLVLEQVIQQKKLKLLYTKRLKKIHFIAKKKEAQQKQKQEPKQKKQDVKKDEKKSEAP